MVWVLESPNISKRNSVIQKYLNARIPSSGNTVVKLLELNDVIHKMKFRSPEEIERYFFIDKQKTRPIFSKFQAKQLFRYLQKIGGTADEALIYDQAIRAVLEHIREYVPSIITTTIDTAYPYITILKTLQDSPEFGPWVEIAKESIVQFASSAIVTTDTIASETAGPIGEMMVAIPIAIAGLGVVATHIMEDELGEALLAFFLILPFVGPILYTSAVSFGKVAHTFQQNAGKRLTTRKHITSKWKKTRRT